MGWTRHIASAGNKIDFSHERPFSDYVAFSLLYHIIVICQRFSLVFLQKKAHFAGV